MEASDDPRLMAAIDLIGRTGADQFQIRYSDDSKPVVWMALANWRGTWEVGASTSPVQAVFRLCDQVIDGGQCTHCHKPTGFVPEVYGMPVPEYVCWYQFDPELATFRRGCE
jgi:hypothetical protein